jgi:hypothetical protein
MSAFEMSLAETDERLLVDVGRAHECRSISTFPITNVNTAILKSSTSKEQELQNQAVIWVQNIVPSKWYKKSSRADPFYTDNSIRRALMNTSRISFSLELSPMW